MFEDNSYPSSQCLSCSCIFDEHTHIPKFLPCGHTLCSFCIHYSINVSSIVRCPFCLLLHSIREFPINFKIVQTLRQIKHDEQILRLSCGAFDIEKTAPMEVERMQIDYVPERPKAKTVKKPKHSRIMSENFNYCEENYKQYQIPCASVAKPHVTTIESILFGIFL